MPHLNVFPYHYGSILNKKDILRLKFLGNEPK